MFDDIEDKLRGIAKIVFRICVVLSAISGIAMIIAGFVLCDNMDEEVGIPLIFGGIAASAVGILFSYIISCVLYGLGELIYIDRGISSSAKQSDTKEPVKSPKTPGSTASKPEYGVHKWRCPKCGNMISENPCPHCGNNQSNNHVWLCPKCGSKNLAKNTKCWSCDYYHLETSETEKSDNARPVPQDDGQIICSKCGFKQPPNRSKCWECGAVFDKEKDE